MFVNLWKATPFLRLLLPLVAGIITGLYTAIFPWWLWIICCTGWCLPAFLPLVWRFRLRYARGVCVTGAVFCLGMGLQYEADIRHRADWFGHAVKDTATLVVRLTEEPVKKTNSWRVEAEVINADGRAGTGKILLYFREAPPLHYAARLVLRTAVRVISGSGNLGAFDYGRYCSYRNLYHQAFLGNSNWRQLPGNDGCTGGKWLVAARNYCLQTLRAYIPHREEHGVAQALLIGYRNELDQDIVQAYTNTGVVHIIAISGLHLGLIYITLLQLLRWLPARRAADICKALLLIAVLWAFSLLTGASASVLRSAVMFTTIAVGQFMISRHSNIFNTLAAAAFLLLCYQPYFLLDAGFQLSFLAVAGIVLCYKPLYDAWMIRNKWLDKIWQMVVVSLAAQVFTWPVCLFYFRQFPNYFLAANLVAVPLSTVLLYGEILLVAVPWLGGALGPLLQWGIAGMNWMIQRIDAAPGAVTANIYMNFAQLLCLYVLTIACCVWWLLQRKLACWWALGALLAFTAIGTVHRLEVFNQPALIVYNSHRQMLVEIIHQGRGVLMSDSAIASTPLIAPDTLAAFSKYTTPAHLIYNITKTAFIPRPNGLIDCHGRRVLLWQGMLPPVPPSRKIKVDYIILSKGAPRDISRFEEFFIYEKIIFDASCPPFLLRKWKSDCNKLPLRCFSVPDKGAFVVNL
ncbi:ComEC family competence protein [Chitinophaga lutea]|uniref:ComEC family competence protein n=1 Tax=Chitinophaga lutea TaxID=2488634 RepID=A0A3N4Q3J7_9BACT|nr:ComEC/Rec2 family competence protein [Chitinophaga lutea]RPE13789.1 ComEC family competence protein [Chitinophaga lutea]